MLEKCSIYWFILKLILIFNCLKIIATQPLNKPIEISYDIDKIVAKLTYNYKKLISSTHKQEAYLSKNDIFVPNDFKDLILNKHFDYAVVRDTNNVSNACMQQWSNFFKAFSSGERWTLQVIDSYAKPPSGILQGAFIWTGEYSECLNVSISKPSWQAKYCTITNKPVKNKMEDETNLDFGLTYGVCVPGKCSNQDIAIILNEFLQRNHKPNNFYDSIFGNFSFNSDNVICQEEKHLDTASIIAITLISTVVGLILISTFIHLIVLRLKRIQEENISRNILIQINEDTVSLNQNETQPANQSQIIYQESHSETTVMKLISSFSLVTNSKKIFNFKSDDFSLKTLHAVRFLSLAWVILGHSYGFLILFSDNLIEIKTLLDRFSFAIIANGYFPVDTFFLLSGLLASYMFLKELNKPSSKFSLSFMIKYYLHRIWRLSPPYYIMLMFSVVLTKYLGSGPLYPVDGFERNSCSHWWLNLLYVNNFGNPNEMCFIISWYLANDMQFHWIAPLMLIPFAFGKKLLGSFISLLFIIGSMISIVMALLKEPGSEVGVLGPKTVYFSEWVYQKPWTRIGPFIIGIILGCILFDEVSRKASRTKIKIGLNILLWIIALSLTSFCLFFLYPDLRIFPQVYYSTAVHIIYQMLCRTLWAIGLAYIIYACETSNGGIINDILTWKIWIPLSRLTYSAYLVHLTVIFYFYSSQEHTLHIQDQNMIYYFVANLIFSYVGAFFLSVTFELPFIGLERILLKKK